MIRLVHHWTDAGGVAHLPGDEIELDHSAERALVAAGYAQPVLASPGESTEPVVPPRRRRRE